MLSSNVDRLRKSGGVVVSHYVTLRWRQAGTSVGRAEVALKLWTDERVECRTINSRRERLVKSNAMLERIVAFNQAQGGGVLIEKRSNGYSLFREDNGRPIARLRPSDKEDLVEILWWSYRGKWEQIGDMGPMTMALEAALEYIAKDPVGIFWS